MMTKMIHSYWAYIVLIVLIIAVVNAIMGLRSKKEYKAANLRIALFALIAAHIQLIIGLIAYFTAGLGFGGFFGSSILLVFKYGKVEDYLTYLCSAPFFLLYLLCFYWLYK